MIIVCNHGYFYFYEDESGEVATFNTYYNQDLVQKENYFTFSALAGLKDYAIKGLSYGGAIVNKTYEGAPCEIMRQNGLVYNYKTKLLTNKLLSGSLIEPIKSYNFWFLNGLIVPGSYTKDIPRKILSYACKVNLKELIYRYNEFNYE